MKELLYFSSYPNPLQILRDFTKHGGGYWRRQDLGDLLGLKLEAVRSQEARSPKLVGRPMHICDTHILG